MEIEEAKALLSRYRPGVTERGNLKMAEALALAQKDAKLSEWFRQHCQATSAGTPTEIIRRYEQEIAIVESDPKWRWTGWIVAAGLVVVGLICWQVYAYLQRPRERFEDFRDRMARSVQHSFPMKVDVSRQEDAREYFRTNGGAFDYISPEGTELAPAHGAAVMTWQSHTVSLVGLQRAPSNTLFLFVADKSSFENPPPSGVRLREHIGHLDTITWMTGDRVYVLAGSGLDDLGVKKPVNP